MRYFILFLALMVLIPSAAIAKESILDIQEVTSPKGLKAWLVEDKKLPIISIQFSFQGAGAVNNSSEKQGLSRLLSNMMDEGAGDLTSQEFQKILSDNSISLSFGSGRDDFGGQIVTLSRNKEKAYELLKLALTKPRFDEEPLERMRLSNITRIRSSMTDPDWIEARFFNDLAYAGHPYALNSGGTITSLHAITADDLREFKKDYLTKDRLFISAAGNISPRELSKVIDQIFGALPAEGKKNTINNITLQNTGKTYLYEKDIPQTLITSSLNSIDRQDPDYYALIVMDHIFGSSGFGSRLMEEAREKRGLTYGIYSGMAVQDYISSFSISTSTKNATAKEMMQVIKKEMENMIKKPVTEQEMNDAKSYIIGSMPLSLTSTSSIADTVLDMQLKGRSKTYLDEFPNKIDAVTVEDIQRVAQRILKPDSMITVMVGSPKGINSISLKKTLPNVE